MGLGLDHGLSLFVFLVDIQMLLNFGYLRSLCPTCTANKDLVRSTSRFIAEVTFCVAEERARVQVTLSHTCDLLLAQEGVLSDDLAQRWWALGDRARDLILSVRIDTVSC